MKRRHIAFSTLLASAAVLAATGARPAHAESCHLTLKGRLVVDDAPCEVVRRRGVITIGQGGAVLATVRHSVLAADLPDDRAGRPARRRPRLRSFGAIVISDSLDDKTCYFNQTITLCVER